MTIHSELGFSLLRLEPKALEPPQPNGLPINYFNGSPLLASLSFVRDWSSFGVTFSVTIVAGFSLSQWETLKYAVSFNLLLLSVRADRRRSWLYTWHSQYIIKVMCTFYMLWFGVCPVLHKAFFVFVILCQLVKENTPKHNLLTAHVKCCPVFKFAAVFSSFISLHSPQVQYWVMFHESCTIEGYSHNCNARAISFSVLHVTNGKKFPEVEFLTESIPEPYYIFVQFHFGLVDI